MTGIPFCTPACRERAGLVEDGDGNVTGKCPCRSPQPAPLTAAAAKAVAHADVAAARAGQMEAAVRIIRDHARILPVLSANDVRDAMKAAQVDGPVVGAAFARCVKTGVIEPDQFVQSTDVGTHSHHIRLYASRLYGQNRRPA